MTATLTISVLPDAPQLGRAAAEYFLRVAALGTPRRPVWVALSGGSTPRLLYAALRESEGDRRQLRSAVRYYFADERAVSPDSEDSNYHLAHREFFEPLAIDPSAVARMRGECTDLNGEATRYGAELESGALNSPHNSRLRPMDLVVLGMGNDGHTASIFPGDPTALGLHKPVYAVTIAQKISRRLTLSRDYLCRAERVLFMASGEEKAETIRRVLQPVPGEPELPAAMIHGSETIWLLDAAAARQLDAGDRRITHGDGTKPA